jgi:hypothetical protein
MEHLRIQADRFWKQGQLQEDEMETIINEMRKEMAEKEDGGRASDSARAHQKRYYAPFMS